MNDNFILIFFEELKKRNFNIGTQDYLLLHKAMCNGFGLTSHEKLKNLFSTLFAKSKEEQHRLESIFEDMIMSEKITKWEIKEKISENTDKQINYPNNTNKPEIDTPYVKPDIPTTKKMPDIPDLDLGSFTTDEKYLILTPKYPLTFRETAQNFNDLKINKYNSVFDELDIDKTIFERCNTGVFSPIIFKPKKINKSSILLLIDREGSMQPSHNFIDQLVNSIYKSGRFEIKNIFYFNNFINEYDDIYISDKLEGLFPNIDKVFSEIKPSKEGFIFKDKDMTEFIKLDKVIKLIDKNTNVFIISDAGAIKSKYNVNRIITTISFIKELKKHTNKYIWLNPLPKKYWNKKLSTSKEISKHIQMFSIDKKEINLAIKNIKKLDFSKR